ncbi:endonuclease/exonuclease/phosphatase family protein [Methylobacillus gramineus]|uniref:endonuclease/exonuclease/phosphatase family protein n=1 Tax=Methylobacillus gramineus TaxID=755169 RepID=UPI001CFFC9A2|nr:endonuclease/exonuclease/phosphatase family protein [Methylobacillus gramineus]MCB5184771.1 endonuclease/exonuclease/phosphatase family protein [Methylobacillus gramineus]
MIWNEILTLLVVVLTAGSLVRRNEWWFRGLDFPRLQIIALGLLALILLIVPEADWDARRMIALAALLLALTYQFSMVLPYTAIWRTEVKKIALKHYSRDKQISILVANVLMTNNKHYLLLQQIRKFSPDVVLTLETDRIWEQALSAIEPEYPHVVRVPLDNLYGMHLYSRLPLKNAQIKYLLSDQIPSIHATVILPCGAPVSLYCMHPEPPSPTEAQESTLRDAELLMVGDEAKESEDSVIVMGDLNDVAWSRTTRLFQRISGLLDPRIGRHHINTYHADYPIFRWALDHIFHSPDFGLVRMQRVAHIGSDHFPVFTHLQLSRTLEYVQAPEDASSEDEAEAEEKIEEGIEKANETPSAVA